MYNTGKLNNSTGGFFVDSAERLQTFFNLDQDNFLFLVNLLKLRFSMDTLYLDIKSSRTKKTFGAQGTVLNFISSFLVLIWFGKVCFVFFCMPSSEHLLQKTFVEEKNNKLDLIVFTISQPCFFCMVPRKSFWLKTIIKI